MKKLILRVLLIGLVLSMGLSCIVASADYCRVINGKMPIYSDSGLSKKIGTVPKWTIALVKSTNSNVAKLNINGRKCYAKTSYLATAYDISPFELYGTMFINKKCKVYSYPETKARSKTVRRGLEVEIIESNGTMYLIRSLDQKYMGYVLNENLSMNP